MGFLKSIYSQDRISKNFLPNMYEYQQVSTPQVSTVLTLQAVQYIYCSNFENINLIPYLTF